MRLVIVRRHRALVLVVERNKYVTDRRHGSILSFLVASLADESDIVYARKRPRRRRAAECSQQFPSSDSDRHVALPCEGGLVKGTVSHRKRAVLTLKDGGAFG